MKRVICTTVAELRSALAKADPQARLYTPLPPFHGVELIEQKDGRILIAPPKGKPDASE